MFTVAILVVTKESQSWEGEKQPTGKDKRYRERFLAVPEASLSLVMGDNKLPLCLSQPTFGHSTPKAFWLRWPFLARMILRTGCFFQPWDEAHSRHSINVYWMTRWMNRIRLAASCSWGLAPLDWLGSGELAKYGQRRPRALRNRLVPDSPQLQKVPTGGATHHSHSRQRQRWPRWRAIVAIPAAGHGWTCLVSEWLASTWHSDYGTAGARYTVTRARISERTFTNFVLLCAEHSLTYKAGRRSTPHSLVESKLKTQSP